MAYGTKFAVLKAQLARKGVRDPGGLAATIGRKKMTKAKFQARAAHGRVLAAMKRKD